MKLLIRLTNDIASTIARNTVKSRIIYTRFGNILLKESIRGIGAMDSRDTDVVGRIRSLRGVKIGSRTSFNTSSCAIREDRVEVWQIFDTIIDATNPSFTINRSFNNFKGSIGAATVEQNQLTNETIHATICRSGATDSSHANPSSQ